jgi:hypothetical protein
VTLCRDSGDRGSHGEKPVTVVWSVKRYCGWPARTSRRAAEPHGQPSGFLTCTISGFNPISSYPISEFARYPGFHTRYRKTRYRLQPDIASWDTILIQVQGVPDIGTERHDIGSPEPDIGFDIGFDIGCHDIGMNLP